MITNEWLKHYYHRDTLGSITHMTDSTGTIIERYECTPFGQTTIYTGPGPDMTWNTADDAVSTWSRIYNTYIFQARRYDEEAQLYYFRTRHYAPNTGRFVQRDKPGDWYEYKNIGNGYNFPSSNPLTLLDPMGKNTTVSQNLQTGEITVTQNVIYIGPNAKPAIMKKIAANIEKAWNDAGDMGGRAGRPPNSTPLWKKNKVTFKVNWKHVKMGDPLEKIENNPNDPLHNYDKWYLGGPGTKSQTDSGKGIQIFYKRHETEIGTGYKAPNNRPTKDWDWVCVHELAHCFGDEDHNIDNTGQRHPDDYPNSVTGDAGDPPTIHDVRLLMKAAENRLFRMQGIKGAKKNKFPFFLKKDQIENLGGSGTITAE